MVNFENKELQNDRNEEIRREIWNRLEGKIWSGQDISIANDTIINPNSTEFVQVVFPEIPQPLRDLPLSSFENLDFSTRSRIAQSETEVEPDAARDLPDTLFINPETGQLNGLMRMRNHSRRPTWLPEKTRIAEPYIWDGTHIIGEELQNLLATRQIVISGKKGIDWDWDIAGLYQPRVQGLSMALDLNTIYRIRPSNDKLEIPDNSFDYRQYIESHSEIAEQMPTYGVRIAQTKSQLAINGPYTAMLDTNVSYGFYNVSKRHRHIKSLALKGKGQTPGWNIKTEIAGLGPLPDTVHLSIARNFE